MYRLLIVLFLMVSTAAAGQTVKGTPNFNEFFRQKKTQRRYMVKQIALLQTYYRFQKKGYDVSQKGLNLIGTIKDGNFRQHKTYFASLKAVKPVIRNYGRVQLTLSQFNNVQAVVARIKDGPYREEFTADEWRDVTQACNLLEDESTSVRDDLMLVVTSDELQMTDDQRIERIDRLNEEMASVYLGARDFASSIESLWKARAKAKQDVRLMQHVNGSGV